jgi:hypothetical protein
MAETTTQSNNRVIKWRKDIWSDYQRMNRFSRYMGNSAMSIICRHYELKTGGEQINVNLGLTLSNTGVGSGTLVGNEEQFQNYGCRFWIDWARNAVVWKKNQIQKASFDPMAESRPSLTKWGLRRQRDDICQALAAIPSEAAPAGLDSDSGQTVNGILFNQATTAQKNQYVTDNADRLLFGDLKSNLVSGNFATSAANVDATNGKLTSSNLMLLKRIAEATTASQPAITPYMTEDDVNAEWYVVFVGSRQFRDIESDTAVQNANREARAREGDSWKENPLFRSGDLIYEGMVITKVPELDAFNMIPGVGGSGIDIAPVFLCGQGALSQVWGQLPKPTQLIENDYGFRKGVGIEMAYGVGKNFFKTSTGALKMWGMAVGYFAATADQ